MDDLTLTSTERRPAERRPALDGIRAVAVGLVIAFHCGVGPMAGGFIGVDVFFVLSGYLVTAVLMRAHEESGRIQLGRFYSRRVRRLLPAAVVTLVATVAVFSSLVSAVELESIQRAARAALLYVANWFFIAESTDYFAADVNRNPVLHMWSLAVEEQFYLLWPLLLSGVMAVGGRLGRRGPSSRRFAATVTALGAVVSVGAAQALAGSAPSRAYFGTDTRAYQLLVGALLALVPGVVGRARRRPGAASLLAWVGLGAVGVLATSIVEVGPVGRGAFTALAVVGLIVGVEAVPTGSLGRLLSIDPVVYLGQISYGIYLWHWPLVLALDELVEVGTPARLVTVTMLSCGLAALSHRLLEMPVRTWPVLDRIPSWSIVAVGVTLSVVAAIVVVPRYESTARNRSEVGSETGLTPVPADLDVVAVRNAGYGTAARCVGQAPENCVMIRGSGPHIMLMGNSNAEMLVPAFVKLAEARDLTLSVAIVAGCPWPLGIDAAQPERRELCRSSRSDFYDRLVPTLDPDVILVASNIYGGNMTEVMDDDDRALAAAAQRSLPRLTGGGQRRVVLIEPIPTAGFGSESPLACLDTATFTEQCRFTDASQGSWYRSLLRRLDEGDDAVSTLSIERLVCPLAPVCDPMVAGKVVFFDDAHITAAWSEAISDDLATLLAGAGLIPVH